MNVVGMEDLQKRIMGLGPAAEKGVSAMLEAGAAVLVEAQSREALRFNETGRGKGALAKSIKAGKVKKSGSESYIEVFPQGVDTNHTKGGVRNAVKGFVLEYGRSNMPARPWISAANDASGAEVNAAMEKVWKEKNGS
jgi:hypothetical protein